MKNFVKFNGNIYSARQDTKPFSPLPLHPQSNSLNKANDCIKHGTKCSYPELNIRNTSGQIKKNFRIVAGRIYMQVLNKLNSRKVDILMYQR